MSTQFDTVLTTEVGNLVGLFEVPYTLFGMQLAGLHIILSSDTAKLSLHQSNLVVIAYVTLIQGNANHEVILIGILQFYIRIRISRCSPLCPRTQAVHSHRNGQNGP